MEAVSLGEGVASGLSWNQPRLCFKLASKEAAIFATIDHDRATIGLRSGVDRAPDAPGNVV